MAAFGTWAARKTGMGNADVKFASKDLDELNWLKEKLAMLRDEVHDADENEDGLYGSTGKGSNVFKSNLAEAKKNVDAVAKKGTPEQKAKATQLFSEMNRLWDIYKKRHKL